VADDSLGDKQFGTSKPRAFLGRVGFEQPNFRRVLQERLKRELLLRDRVTHWNIMVILKKGGLTAMHEANRISELLVVPEQELFAEIGSSLFGKPMSPVSMAKTIERGVQWFKSKKGELSQAVCGNTAVMRAARQDVPTHELVVAVCGALDLGVHSAGGAPVVTVAVLIVRLGLHEFCSASWTQADSQPGSGQE
jgi:hypothetical protein